MVGLSVPAYVLALVLVYVFAVAARWLPAIGFVHLGESVRRNIEFLTLPAVSIAFPLSASTRACCARTSSISCASQDYVTTARAKGLGQWRILTRHVLRNSLFGLVTSSA